MQLEPIEELDQIYGWRFASKQGFGLAQTVSSPAEVPSRPEDGADHAPRILIVEDHERYSIDLMQALKRLQGKDRIRFDIDIANNAAEASEYLLRDEIDIYIVDLEIPKDKTSGASEAVGNDLVHRILENSKAGLIVHSRIPAERNAELFLDLGADDYIEKSFSPSIVRAKVVALWRRVQLTRPKLSNLFAHTRRTFLVGGWRFIIGTRDLTNEVGKVVRISQTEHAFLRHLCVLQNHEIDRETFNVSVLGRPSWERDKRIDNLVYRLRNKLGSEVQIISKGDGIYKLLDVREVGTFFEGSGATTANGP